MDPQNSEILTGVSDTALIIARIRGQESTLPDRLFNDPLAFRLAGARGEQLAQQGQKRWLTRTLAKSLQVAVVIRTILIDQIIEQAVARGEINCVVNLGAGLDARPYRLNLPRDFKWIEVDFPKVIEHKIAVTEKDIPNCEVERVKLDLSDSVVRKKFFAKLAKSGNSVLVLTEGLLLYLQEGEVVELANELRQSKVVKKWVTDLNSPFTLRGMARVWRTQLGVNVQFYFGQDSGPEFFSRLSWKVVQELPVFDLNRKYNRVSPLTRTREILSRVLGERFAKRFRRSSVILEIEPETDL